MRATAAVAFVTACIFIRAAIVIAPAGVPAPASSAYDPPAGSVPFFPASPFRQKIPNPPTVNPNSAAWVAGMGPFSLNNIAAVTPAGTLVNHHEPVYYNHGGANVPVTIHCTAHFGNRDCSTEGMTVYIDPRETPQNGAKPGEDDHLALIDVPAGYEYDFWVVHEWPPQNGVLTVNWAGRCALDGNGFTNPSYSGPHWNSGCASTASGTPISMGLIRAKDLMAALHDPHGSLPEAIAFGIPCPGPGPLPAPFLGSGDGKCPGHAPEGSRLYLAMHDADVDALGVAPIVAVILRTLDEDHYGAFLIDTGGRQPGMQLAAQSDTTYTAWGLPGPLMTQYLPEAQAEGLPGAAFPYDEKYEIGLPIPPAVEAAVRFL